MAIWEAFLRHWILQLQISNKNVCNGSRRTGKVVFHFPRILSWVISGAKLSLGKACLGRPMMTHQPTMAQTMLQSWGQTGFPTWRVQKGNSVNSGRSPSYSGREVTVKGVFCPSHALCSWCPSCLSCTFLAALVCRHVTLHPCPG